MSVAEPDAPARAVAASTVEASSARAGINALHFDLLVAILSAIPAPPRLSVVSYVCKRWRAAVVQSVTKLTVSAKAPQSIFELFPRLCDVRVSATHATRLKLPTRVTRLRVLPLEMLSAVQPTTIELSAPLRDLRLNYEANHFAGPLLSASVSALCTLEIDWITLTITLNLMNSTHFPHLTSLALFVSNDSTMHYLMPFLSTHAPQLTSLRIEGRHFNDEGVSRFVSLPWTRLRSLAVLRLEPPLSGADLATFMHHSPALTAVRYVDRYNDILDAPPEALTALTDLTMAKELTAEEGAFLLRLPRLRRLRGAWDGVPEALLRCTAHMPIPYDQVWPALQARDPRYTHIESLSIGSAAPEGDLRLHLPHLRFFEIYISLPVPEFERTLRACLSAVQRPGQVRRVYLLVPIEFYRDESTVPRWRALMAELMAAGISKVRYNSPLNAAQYEALRTLPWLQFKTRWYSK